MRPLTSAFLIFSIFLFYDCDRKGTSDKNIVGKSEVGLDGIEGSLFDTTLLCGSSVNSFGENIPIKFSYSYSHFLVLYFTEAMCSVCTDEAIKFLARELKQVPPEQIKIVTLFSNARTAAILLKMNHVQLPVCNVEVPPIKQISIEMDKPIFLILDRQGKIVDYFQLKDNMEERMRRSVKMLYN